MLGKFGKAIAIAAMAGGSVFVSAGSASAAHCVSPEGDSPGFSYFGNDHNQEATHPNEGVNNGAHSPGASSCGDIPGSASDRAPGKS